MAATECKLYERAVFGPVESRRLGNSLGINLLPEDLKVCNYDCVYCECGWTDMKFKAKAKFPSRIEVISKLRKALNELRMMNEPPDSITFAGNGEPTLHPEFNKIVDDVIAVRDELSPASAITVFSNGTLLNKKEIVSALKKADKRILKFDAGTEEDFLKIDRPLIRRSVEWLVNHLKYFDRNLILQSMFIEGSYNGEYISNTRSESISKWLECVEEIRPELVMIYSVSRPTAAPGIEQVSKDVLNEIAEQVESLGIRTQVN